MSTSATSQADNWITAFRLGHHDVSTTMVHTHVLNRGGLGVKSPPDE